MGERLRALITYFLPVGLALAGEELRRHRLMVSFLLITALYAISYVPICILIDYRSALYAIPLTFTACIMLAFALRNGLDMVVVCNIYLFILSTLISWLWLSTGGLTTSPNDQAFSALFPAIALLLIGRKWAAVWLVYCILLVVAHGIPTIMGHTFERGMNEDFTQTFTLISLAGHAVLLYIFVNIFETSRNRAHQALESANAELAEEKLKVEELLLNILPEEVAQELKIKGHADAHEFEQVSILFSDFKGFTQASEHMTPQQLVEELNICFKEFDEIITSRGIEKIKTIGDAYMAAGGLKGDASAAAARTLEAALEMQIFIHARKAVREEQGLPAFEMRVGIHTGPVVAGIVGVKKFQYDIWGDTVNTASRMESSGEVGQVNISEATYELVKEQAGSLFTFTPRGKVQAKGKGEMEMYFVSTKR